MLTQKFRPQTFSEIVGQDINVEILRSVAKAPKEAPKVFIFRGDFGTGKTSCARILAKTLNCEYGKTDPCGDCPVCSQDLSYVPYYAEYDSSDVGNKESIQELRDDFLVTTVAVKWKVIVLDEFHLASRQAQAALLKTLEDLPENLFMVICTTNVEKIIPTIRSRSVDLVFRKVPFEGVKKNLERIMALEGICSEDVILDRICLHSRGHVRDSVMLLDVYKTTPASVFLESLCSSEVDLIRLLCAIKLGDKDRTRKALGQVCSTPLDILRTNLYAVITEALRVYSTDETKSLYEKEYRVLVDIYQGDLLKLMAFSMSDWAVNSFRDDQMVQAFFWAAFVAFGKAAQKKSETVKDDRFRRRG